MTTPKADAVLVARFLSELAAATNDYTMPSQQLLLLLALYVHGEVPQQDLTKYTGVQRSSNSRNISRLGSGETPWSSTGPQLVEAYEDLKDRRNKIVRLTPKGRALLDSVAQATHNQ
jgi:DNA-binding MarR family transcriptional regulator